VTTIVEDKREIIVINDDNAGRTLHEVGENGVTKIEPYNENGLLAPVPYFAIWKGWQIYERLPATSLRVNYKME